MAANPQLPHMAKEGGFGNYYLGKGAFGVRPMPWRALAPDEVRILNMVAGICGTDIHIQHGEKGSANPTPPVVLGHEYAGEVVEVGTDVTTLHVGDKVTVDPNIPCGHCHFCKLGKKQLCTNMKCIGVTLDGGFAQYSVVPLTQAYKLAPHVSYEAGSMVEPLACCLHGIDRARLRAGDTCLVVGGGAIGLLMVQLARLSGAAKVLLSEPVAMRREMGLQLGADAALDPKAAPLPEQIKQAIGEEGVDTVIECVGLPIATTQSFEAVKRGGTVLLFSVPSMGATYPLDLFDLFSKELTVLSSFVNPDTHGRSVELINSGRIQVEPLITHRYPLEGLEEALKMQTLPASIKVIITPNR